MSPFSGLDYHSRYLLYTDQPDVLYQSDREFIEA